MKSINIFDTHAHLDSEQLFDKAEKIVDSAQKQGINLIMSACSGDGEESIKKTVTISESFPNVFGSAGIHPHNATLLNDTMLEKIKKIALNHKRILAIGEIGLDYYYNLCPHEVQINAFKLQIELARQLNLPIIVHVRDAHDDAIAILKQFPDVSGVIHCFTGNIINARSYLDLNYYLSFSGIVTYKNAAQVKESAQFAPINKITIETDSPYLVPFPLRGKQKINTPSNIVHTASVVAQLKKLELNDFANITTSNGRNLFKLNN